VQSAHKNNSVKMQTHVKPKRGEYTHTTCAENTSKALKLLGKVVIEEISTSANVVPFLMQICVFILLHTVYIFT